MNYEKLKESGSIKTNKKSADESVDYEEEESDENIILEGDDQYDEYKEKAYEYYKENNNLDDLYYSTKNKKYKSTLEDWMKEFHDRLEEEKRNKHNEIDIKNDEIVNSIKNTNININKVKPKKNDNNIPKKSSEGSHERIKDKKFKILFETNGFDLDDLVQVELPNDYIEQIHEDNINNLGEEMMNCLKNYKNDNKEENLMSNDDFMILLALLRKRKEKMVEKVPYYINYNTKLESVYINEKEEYENDDVDINQFIKEFIQQS